MPHQRWIGQPDLFEQVEKLFQRPDLGRAAVQVPLPPHQRLQPRARRAPGDGCARCGAAPADRPRAAPGAARGLPHRRHRGGEALLPQHPAIRDLRGRAPTADQPADVLSEGDHRRQGQHGPLRPRAFFDLGSLGAFSFLPASAVD